MTVEFAVELRTATVDWDGTTEVASVEALVVEAETETAPVAEPEAEAAVVAADTEAELEV